MTFDASSPSTLNPSISSSASARRRKHVLQRTLKTSIGCTGIGLHTGVRVSMKLHPAEADTGIVFRRVDLIGGGAEIPADWSRVTDSRMCTVIADENGVSIATVEHLMSTFAGLEIDNAIVEINGPEVPAMDGSAAPFAFLVECAGAVEQGAVRRAMRIIKPYSYKSNGRVVTLGPWKGGLRVDFTIDFRAAAIGLQSCSFVVDRECFKAEISRARTFGLLSDVTALREAGLARGGNLDNAIVVDGNRILNEEGLRHAHEFVHHKALDALGDLYLTGYPIIGHFVGRCSSHADTARLMRQVLADTSGWEMVDLYEDDLATAAWGSESKVVAFA
ncbi:MAG: UDP-3-O-[3-hydroxymyristoyl] N-acetylglucosamine deacetylase [Rhodospirillaceae bacterium]|nr:MAG: UDP-3-O-[3-hydroxymyristoyl] N-acetylglucosamine deacetylase [Rhodospirillaceae bacterium]